MSMTRDEFAPLAALLESLFKDTFDATREEAYAEALGRFTAAEVRAAIIELAGTPGGAFSPSSREIAAAAEKIRAVGTWDWAREKVRALFDLHVGRDQAMLFSYGQAGALPAQLWKAIEELDAQHGSRCKAFIADHGLRALLWPGSYESRVLPAEWERTQQDAGQALTA